jgi:hypothetical protein
MRVTSNIIAPTITCSNINISNNAVVDGLATINSATISEVIGNVEMNGNINFPFNSTSDPLVLPPNTQPLYDMSYIRNITCGGLYVQGGWNGNTVLPPYHNNTSVTIGNDGGITSPGVVVINGQNPGIPGENITNALTVRGDVSIDFGILTTYNGLVCEPFNEFANAIEVNGITALNGLVNILGATTIEGTTGILGNTTITGALEVTGGCLFTGGLAQLGGNFTLGAFATTYTGTINTPLTINNELNMGNNNISNVSIITAGDVRATNVIASNITASNINILSTLKVPSLSTNVISVYSALYDGEEQSGAILFSDISGNYKTVMSYSEPYFGIFNLSSFFVLTQGDSLQTADGNSSYLAQESIGIQASNGFANLTSLGTGVVIQANIGYININAANTITLLSDDAGIGLEAETGVFMNDNYGASLNLELGNITALAEGSNTEGQITLSTFTNNININSGSNIVAIAKNNIFCQATDVYQISTTSVILTRDVYMSNIYGIGGTNIRVNDNISMPSSVLYAGAVQTANAYVSTLNAPFGSSNAINVVNPLNMCNNYISNVTNLYASTISTTSLNTSNISVSSINFKQYPYTSTLNAPPSTFSYAASNTQSRTIPYVLYSNVAFPNAGWFNVSQKAIFTRASGTSDTHQSVFYTPGAFISTPSIKDGYASLPYTNQNNNSTFTTLTTELYISSSQLNRNITLYNDTNNNFVGNLFMDRLVATYNPSRGINPE